MLRIAVLQLLLVMAQVGVRAVVVALQWASVPVGVVRWRAAVFLFMASAVVGGAAAAAEMQSEDGMARWVQVHIVVVARDVEVPLGLQVQVVVAVAGRPRCMFNHEAMGVCEVGREARGRHVVGRLPRDPTSLRR